MIAVYMNSDGLTASLTDKGLVRVYGKEGEEWRVEKDLPFDLEHKSRSAEVRTIIMEMINQLGECKVFTAKEVSGQLYYVLEAKGYEAFEAEGKPEEYLDSIWKEIQAMKKEESENTETSEKTGQFTVRKDAKPSTNPEVIDQEGVYWINLIPALNTDCTLTSKKILIPFLRKMEFDCLNVICDHIPKWFDNEMSSMGLIFRAVQLKHNLYQASIIKRDDII